MKNLNKKSNALDKYLFDNEISSSDSQSIKDNFKNLKYINYFQYIQILGT